jgi:hypothetical protein
LTDSFTIYFEQSGGFTGITITAVLDDKSLSTGESEEVHLLIERSNFFTLQIRETAGKSRPDQLYYKISVETPTHRNSVTVYDHQVTDELRPLIRFLVRKARTRG